MINFLYVFVIFCLLSAFEVHADGGNNYMIVGSNSYHLKTNSDNSDYNETNNAIGFEFNLSDWMIFKKNDKLTIAVYEDSYDKKINKKNNPNGDSSIARYISYTHFFNKNHNIRYGVMLGVVKGDSYQDGNVIPLVLPTVVFENKYVGLNIMFLPKFTNDGAYIFGFQYKIGLNW